MTSVQDFVIPTKAQHSSSKRFVIPTQAQRNGPQHFVIPTQAQRNDPQYVVIPTEAERSERSGGTCFCLQLHDRSHLFLPPIFGSRH